jgi:hypothetical protein
MTILEMAILWAGATAAWLTLPDGQAEDPQQDGSTITQVGHGRLAGISQTQAGGWWE